MEKYGKSYKLLLDSLIKILFFIAGIFLIGYFSVQGITKKYDRNKKDNNTFALLLLGMFIGISGDILMLRFPLKDYPQISSLVNPTIFTIFFFSLPVIGAVLGVILSSYVTKKK